MDLTYKKLPLAGCDFCNELCPLNALDNADRCNSMNSYVVWLAKFFPFHYHVLCPS